MQVGVGCIPVSKVPKAARHSQRREASRSGLCPAYATGQQAALHLGQVALLLHCGARIMPRRCIRAELLLGAPALVAQVNGLLDAGRLVELRHVGSVAAQLKWGQAGG